MVGSGDGNHGYAAMSAAVNASRSRLFAVMAHPDDESFGPGGSLAAAAAAGAEVHLVTMTDGAAGTTDDRLAPDALADRRAADARTGGRRFRRGIRGRAHEPRREDAGCDRCR